ncbi:NAD-dependent deacylase [Deinococcus psychrotolerans]|uniref:NAD-dependent protein deacylase n=1 Tax=Deinococcus psychrotolerans TaxID=2489213 RepID=A0A3G8YNU6_9DEIO|nr:NAD-dependent deacylase [Deinococcus psychrotolerans]AZI43271.1 NAD-dependent deacylase [Deinococcus psychrotolerans]
MTETQANSALEQARTLLQAAKRVAVITGAGISAESGIPTFRDAQTGHWARFRPEDLASPEAYQQDPETVWDWYAGRYRDVMAAQPNAGHMALAELERRKSSHPDGFLLATQNVDGLHQRAGSRQLVELHGNLTHARCETCQHLAALPAPETFEPPPICLKCGSRMRPNVVWFSEWLPPEALARAEKAFEAADVALVIGTSSLVQPAAGLALLTLENGGSIIEINPDVTPLSEWASVVLRLKASQALPALLEG